MLNITGSYNLKIRIISGFDLDLLTSDNSLPNSFVKMNSVLNGRNTSDSCVTGLKYREENPVWNYHWEGNINDIN